jgi:predicted dehydrogenase
MNKAPLRLGIVGAHHERGWAKDAHIPALAHLPRFKISAVSAPTIARAQTAASAFGAAHAFDDSLALTKSPDVDVVVVTVRVPQHFDLVMSALAGNKHVFCEWPLGRTVAEAETMTAAAAQSKGSVIVGTQGVASPVVRHAAEIVQSGALGRILSARLIAPTVGWGPVLPQVYAYLNDKNNGATHSTIGVGHALAMVEKMLGRFVDVDARTALQFPKVKIMGADGTMDRTCTDHMAIIGTHQNGCVTVVEASSNRPRDVAYQFSVTGADAELRITGRGGGFQTAELKLETTVPHEPPSPTIAGLPQPAANVAALYAMLADKIDGGKTDAPDFADALHLHRLLAAIDAASETGQRQRIPQ